MFKRKIYSKLLKWKTESNGSSALLIEGARRIGKTTIVKEFGEKEYDEHLIIDFSIVSEDFKNIFDNLVSIDDFFTNIFLSLRIPVLPNGSLIVFDEIQFCPKARQAIKALVKDGRYHYIETGSLVSIKENVKGILIPSEEEAIQMYPMDYEEFLWALGFEDEANILRKYFNEKKPFNQNLHKNFMYHFRHYLAIGGMPKVVSKFLEKRDFYEVENEKRKIINLYENDLKKFDSDFKTICYRIWQQIPSMLSNHTTRFIASSVNQRADSIFFQDTLDKLKESKMVIPVYRCNDPSGGFALTKDETMFKLYFNDIGLFVSYVYSNGENDIKDIYQMIILDKLGMNLGMLYENLVAQTLTANNFIPYYYSWKSNDDNLALKQYEVDFIISKKGKTIPIEVKSKRVSSLVSLNKFFEKNKNKTEYKYIVKPKPFSIDNNTINLPIYMLFALD